MTNEFTVSSLCEDKLKSTGDVSRIILRVTSSARDPRVVYNEQLPLASRAMDIATTQSFKTLGNDYLMITTDDFGGNTKLSSFIQWKKSQGYNVTIVTMSQILQQYPVPPQTVNWLKMSNLENASFTPTHTDNPDQRLIVSWTSGVFGEYDPPGSVVTGFYNIGTASKPQMVNLMWWDRFGGSHPLAETKTVTLTYDGGQQIAVDYPPVMPDFDHLADFFVGLDGNMHSRKTEKWSVWEYIVQNVIGGGVSDRPYGVLSIDWENFGNNRYEDMVSDLSVGRLPVKNLTELGTVIDKIMNYQPFQSGRTLFMEGRENWSDFDAWYKFLARASRLIK